MLNEGNQIRNFISSSGSGTVINYGYGSDFLTNYGSGSTSQKVTVPVSVPQHCRKCVSKPASAQPGITTAVLRIKKIRIRYPGSTSRIIFPSLVLKIQKFFVTDLRNLFLSLDLGWK